MINKPHRPKNQVYTCYNMYCDKDPGYGQLVNKWVLHPVPVQDWFYSTGLDFFVVYCRFPPNKSSPDIWDLLVSEGVQVPIILPEKLIFRVNIGLFW